jgi:hypothetical protein
LQGDLTTGELRQIITEVTRRADVYKVSLSKKQGDGAALRDEALERGVLAFETDTQLYTAVRARDDDGIAASGRQLRSDDYPEGATPEALRVWQRTINTFVDLPTKSLVLHWDAVSGRLWWGISTAEWWQDRERIDSIGRPALVLYRRLAGGWRQQTLGGVPLNNLHPKAQDLAINQATLNRVQTDYEYFPALLLDEDVLPWTERADWVKKARERGWRAKPTAPILAARREKKITPQVIEIAEHFNAEIDRMAQTAVHTAAYANGQTVLMTLKNKDIGFTLEELKIEIADLLERQNGCCALTGYIFRMPDTNPYLRPSLDRKDSGLGYVAGNLQVVTRAANFYKSASDAEDWKLKAKAMRKMALAMQKFDGVGEAVVPSAAVAPTMAGSEPPVPACLQEAVTTAGQ